MDVELTFETRMYYLYVKGRGPSDLDSTRRALTLIEEQARQARLTRILIDARDVEPPRRELDRFFLGEYVAELFGARYRIAVVYQADRINKFAENTAVNRGANLLVAAEEDSAMKWLMQDLPQQSVAGRQLQP